jgi:UDP-N-acetylmuramyl pentapeptide phosphotransferase/UDP-N-acetylglucosamine-1-phosphate transferase
MRRDVAELLARGDRLLHHFLQRHPAIGHALPAERITTAGIVLVLLALFAMTVAPRVTALLLRRLGWMEPNFRGDRICQSFGVAILLQALILLPAYALLAPSAYGVAGTWLLAVAGFGALGLLDDRFGDRRIKGLRGHFRAALRERRITTGFVKAVGGAGLALVIGLRLAPHDPASALLDALLVALSANCINLLDLRPGRAGALFLVSAALLILFCADSRHSLAPLILILLAELPVYTRDARAAAMLGDAGSNLLGACLGLGIASSAVGVPAKIALAAALAGLHVLTERLSLTDLIERVPPLRALDRLTGVR